MGLVRGMARTAVVAGTATAVSNRVSRRQANRWAGQEAPPQQYQEAPPPQYQQPPPQYQQAPQQYQQAPPPLAPEPADAGGSDSMSAELERLAGLHREGVLTDEEFAAAKKSLLGL